MLRVVIFIVLTSLFFNASALAVGATGTPRCTWQLTEETWFPGDTGFDVMVARHNGLAGLADTRTLSHSAVRAWQIKPDTTAYIRMSVETDSCSAPDINYSKYRCDYAGCNESIPGTTHYPVGAKLTSNSCDSSSNVETTVTWIKQSNGTWTVKTAKTEQHTQGCPLS